MSATTDIQSRAFARVDQSLPVRIRLLDEADARVLGEHFLVESTYSERVMADPSVRGSREGQWEKAALSSVLAQLERLERTIVRIAETLNVEVADSGSWIEARSVNISGSGIGLHIPQRLERATPIELEMTLLGDPTAIIRAVGRIVSVVHPDGESLPVGRFHLGIAFESIHKEDQEALVRYTFKLQRAQLRERKQSEPGEEE